MRGSLIHFAAAAVIVVFGVSVVAAQEAQDKTAQDKSTQGKDSRQQQTHEKSGSDAPWYSPSRYNPLKLFKHYKSANDQLASEGHLEDKLSKQLRLQGILAADRELQDVCLHFKDLPNCVAALRLSVSLPVEFTCLKWNMTGVKPKAVAASCAGPAGGKAMPLDRALDLLKPNLDVRTEARNALKKAHDDIKDASS
ncbi:MAG TPA: hypothetical protein VNB49_09280 [Candidatus Dormibacteraeota bacterium]|nr:hypothetical protein [Candidatus Dormibacteraeota bacterium]